MSRVIVQKSSRCSSNCLLTRIGTHFCMYRFCLDAYLAQYPWMYFTGILKEIMKQAW